MRSVQKDWDLVGGGAHARIRRTRTHACPHGGSAPCLGAAHHPERQDQPSRSYGNTVDARVRQQRSPLLEVRVPVAMSIASRSSSKLSVVGLWSRFLLAVLALLLCLRLWFILFHEPSCSITNRHDSPCSIMTSHGPSWSIVICARFGKCFGVDPGLSEGRQRVIRRRSGGHSRRVGYISWTVGAGLLCAHHVVRLPRSGPNYCIPFVDTQTQSRGTRKRRIGPVFNNAVAILTTVHDW